MTADLTPAGELRAAAVRLRSLADAAKKLTEDGRGEWHGWGAIRQTCWKGGPENGSREPTGDAYVAHARHAGRWPEDEWHEAEVFAGPLREALARFIAAMHPGVALAVADVLDDVAAGLEECPPGCHPAADWRPALSVARAFLGTGAADRHA